MSLGLRYVWPRCSNISCFFSSGWVKMSIGEQHSWESVRCKYEMQVDQIVNWFWLKYMRPPLDEHISTCMYTCIHVYMYTSSQWISSPSLPWWTIKVDTSMKPYLPKFSVTGQFWVGDKKVWSFTIEAMTLGGDCFHTSATLSDRSASCWRRLIGSWPASNSLSDTTMLCNFGQIRCKQNDLSHEILAWKIWTLSVYESRIKIRSQKMK